MQIEADLELDSARATADEALSHALTVEDRGQVAAVQVRRALILLSAGDVVGSRAVHDAFLPVALAESSPLWRTDLLYYLALGALRRGDPEADDLLARVRADAEAFDLHHVLVGIAAHAE